MSPGFRDAAGVRGSHDDAACAWVLETPRTIPVRLAARRPAAVLLPRPAAKASTWTERRRARAG